MPNDVSYISQITLPSGNTYLLKDAEARQAIVGGVHYIGVTTTALIDGSTTNPITVEGESYTAKQGDIVMYKASPAVTPDVDREFIWNGSKWDEFGAGIGAFGSLAFKNSATGSYVKPSGAGSVTIPKTYKFTGTAGTVTVTTSLTRVTGVTKTTKYAKAVPSKTKLVTTTIKKATAGTAVDVAKAGTAVAVGTSLTGTKTFATTGVTVSVTDEVLTFTAAGTGTVGLGTSNIVPAVANGTITPVTLTDQVVATGAVDATGSGAAIVNDVSLGLEDDTATGRVGVVTDVDVTSDTGTVTSTGTFTPAGGVATASTETATVTVGTTTDTVTVS